MIGHEGGTLMKGSSVLTKGSRGPLSPPTMGGYKKSDVEEGPHLTILAP